MSDNQLIVFATNEAQKLTLESFHLLKSEFEKRSLDLGVIETAEIDKALSKLNEQTAAEKITAFEFTNAIWQLALDQKEKGIKDGIIFESLIKKGLNEDSAFMVIASLEAKSKELAENYDTLLIIGGFLIAAGIATFILVSNEVFSKMFLVYGLLLIIGGIIRLVVSSSKKSKYKKIQEIIAVENEEIVESINEQAPSKGSNAMTRPEHIQNFSETLTKILHSELTLGNEIEETSKGWPTEETIIVFLKEPFVDKYETTGIEFREIEDPRYWKSEYYEKSTGHILACKFGKVLWKTRG